ncbi:hypothetical protein WJX81_007841 [Elliptochloris bilobata]|uniref:Steroid 5-alpha-reductase DET2 n=1 Tax=Elliptochloris bilobata TaxID=381761 RepID=A0AAW1R377_9CHLO
MAPLIFVALVRRNAAPYGRYSSSAWGSMLIPARVAWLTQEAPSFLVPAGLLAYELARPAASAAPLAALSPSSALLACFLVHYFHRAFVYPLAVQRGSKPTPLPIWLMALAFCTYNGVMQGLYLMYVHPASGSRADAIFWLGLALWALGWGVNLHSDSVLRNLRAPGETGYKVPRGGAFELVSAANYTGEILEWAGFALAIRSLPGLAFAVFTFVNLAPRGAAHHEWYLKRFEHYPRSRRAVIPFLW